MQYTKCEEAHICFSQVLNAVCKVPRKERKQVVPCYFQIFWASQLNKWQFSYGKCPEAIWFPKNLYEEVEE